MRGDAAVTNFYANLARVRDYHARFPNIAVDEPVRG